MVGRAAYQEPWRLLEVDPLLFGVPAPFGSPKAAAEALIPHVDRERARGTRLYAIARHILGLFHAVPGARAFRRHLATEGVKSDAGVEVLRHALSLVHEMDRSSAHSAAA
jgi:tRNA-dihydrouridine synthase A